MSILLLAMEFAAIAPEQSLDVSFAAMGLGKEPGFLAKTELAAAARTFTSQHNLARDSVPSTLGNYLEAIFADRSARLKDLANPAPSGR